MKNNSNLSAGVIAGLTFIVLSIELVASVSRTGSTSYDAVFFGDSIIAGYHFDDEIPDMVSDKTGLSIFNAAFGGMTMSDSNVDHYVTDSMHLYSMVKLSEGVRKGDFTSQYAVAKSIQEYNVDYWTDTSKLLSEVDFASVKYIFIEHGVNDYLNGVLLENELDKYDVYTYGGALRTSIENIKKALPNVEIIILTPTYMHLLGSDEDCTSIDYGGGVLEKYANKAIEIAGEYGLDYIDNYHEVDINKDNYLELIPDGLHGNEAGKTLIADNISRHVLDIIK